MTKVTLQELWTSLVLNLLTYLLLIYSVNLCWAGWEYRYKFYICIKLTNQNSSNFSSYISLWII